ncbi:MAG: EAL domain-containing protein [Pseudomonadota bacterium]
MRPVQLSTLLPLLLLLCKLAEAASPPMYFEHLSLRDGLSQSTANVVYQDSQGFVWIGTESGLNRYDGYEIRRYQSRRDDPLTLPSDYIWDIVEDGDGNLWLATDGGGVVRWVRATDSFQSFPVERGASGSGMALSTSSVRSLALGADGAVWVGTRGGGLNRVDPVTSRVEVFRAGDPATGALSNDVVSALAIDSRNRLWVGTDGGLHRYDASSGNFIHYPHDPERAESLSDNRVIAIAEDTAGTLWIGTFEGGLNRMVESALGAVTFERFQADPNTPGSLSHNYVRAIASDSLGRLWVGTEDGLNLLNSATGTFSAYRMSKEDPNSLSGNYIMDLYEDSGGLLWVGTRSGGVSRWNPRSWSMGHHAGGWLSESLLTAIASTDDGEVWVGSLGDGLARLNPQTRRLLTGADGAPLVPDLQDQRTMSLMVDSQGGLWIGTMTGGLHRYDQDKNRTTVYGHDPQDPSSLGADGVMSLLEAVDGSIWVGTYGGGVSVLDRTSNAFLQWRPDGDDPHALSGPRAAVLTQTPDGSIWVGTDNAGLNRFDPMIGGFHIFRANPEDPAKLPSDAIYALHVATDGELWLGTARGDLIRVDYSSTDRGAVGFEAVVEVGLALNAIYGIESDDRGRLWLATNNGLMRYDPNSGDIKTYRRSHGLQGDEFNFGAHHRGPDGMLYFGGANGLNAFYPEEIEDAAQPPPLVLTDIRILNQPADTGLPPSLVEMLTLEHTQNMISFEFAALDFTAPDENRYEYRLVGFDRDWNAVGPLNQATYTNLDAGRYEFQVRAANSDGVWSESRSIDVRVLPAPWETIWAYIAYATVALLLVFALLRWQRHRHEREAEMRRLENFDRLTGLPNRKLFVERLHAAIDEAEPRDEGIAVIHIDLDKFKRVNDTLGQAVGDNVIKVVASRLAQEVVQSSDGLGRRELAHVGGDEFLIFVRHVSAMPEAERLASVLRDLVCTPVQHAGQEFVVTASLGIASYPEHGDNAEELIVQADTATFKVKQEGGNATVRYTRRMNSRAVQRFELENDLRAAIRQEELEIYFQPKFSAKTFEIIGAEALLRWRHPTRGFVSPVEFIPIAEESGLIGDLGHFVSYAASQQIGAWQRDGMDVVPIAVNLSAAEFHRGDPVETLRLATDVADISPTLIEVEITESMLFRDLGEVARSLATLRELGFSLSVDDFGTGYSSLGYLRDLPLDALKIDRQFVSDIGEDAVSGPICEAIIGVAHSLGLRVIAEGIETEVQVRALQRSGCDEFQGYLFARPLTATQFEYWLLNRQHPLGQRYALTETSHARAS